MHLTHDSYLKNKGDLKDIDKILAKSNIQTKFLARLKKEVEDFAELNKDVKDFLNFL